MPAAFSSVTMTNLQNNVRELYYRRKKIGKLKLTYEEYIATFVPCEVRAHFQWVAPYCAPDTRIHRWELRPPGSGEVIHTMLRMNIEENKPCPPPVARLQMIQGDAPQEVVNKIYHWASRGGDASREFGRVMKVLELLNQNFSRVAIRYYWPTILALCSESPKTSSLVHEMQDLRQPVKLKPLPPGLAQACRLTAETIATARLIPHDIEEDGGGECVIDIVSGQMYTEALGAFYGLQ